MRRTARQATNTLVATLVGLAVTGSPAVAAPPEPADARSDRAGAGRSYTETRLPPGAPVGVVVVLHGSGWQGVGPPEVRRLAAYRDLLPSLRRAGLITVSATYRVGEPGWSDVLALHRQVREKWPSLPVSALGQSSGGTWALLLGAARPLAAVVAEAAPADFASWRTTYPCFYADCRPVAGGRTGLGAHWYDDHLTRLFGADTGPPPNLLDYAPVAHLDPATAPPTFVLSGARQATDGSPLPDGTPGYVDGLEVDPVVTRQQATALAAALGTRGYVRQLARGTSPWVHTLVDEAQLAAAYADVAAFLGGRSRAATVVPGAGRGIPRPPSADGTATIVLCDAAPAGSGLLAVGGWAHAAAPGMDVSDNGCAATPDRAGPDIVPVRGALTGTTLHPDGQDGRVPEGATSSATFRAPPGTTIRALRAAYAGRASTGDWRLSLRAGGTPQLVCTAPCREVDSGDPAARWPARDIAIPPGTTSVTWELACAAPAGCGTEAPGGDAEAAWLNVFEAQVVLADGAAPTLEVAPSLLDGRGTGRVRAADALGVRRLEVRAGERVVAGHDAACDFARPVPCGPLDRDVRVDTAGLPPGPHELTVTVTDAAGRSTTARGVVDGSGAPGAPPPAPPPSPSPDGPGPGPGSPSEPTPAPVPGLAPVTVGADEPFLPATPEDALRRCMTRALLVRDVRRTAAGVVVRGLGPAHAAGQVVQVLLDGRRVASATLSPTGRLTALVRARRDKQRVGLRLGSDVSAPVLLDPPVTLTVRRAAGRLHLAGTVAARGRVRVTIRRRTSCAAAVPLATATAVRGRFAVTVRAPAGRATLAVATARRPGRAPVYSALAAG